MLYLYLKRNPLHLLMFRDQVNQNKHLHQQLQMMEDILCDQSSQLGYSRQKNGYHVTKYIIHMEK